MWYFPTTIHVHFEQSLFVEMTHHSFSIFIVLSISFFFFFWGPHFLLIIDSSTLPLHACIFTNLKFQTPFLFCLRIFLIFYMHAFSLFNYSSDVYWIITLSPLFIYLLMLALDCPLPPLTFLFSVSCVIAHSEIPILCSCYWCTWYACTCPCYCLQ